MRACKNEGLTRAVALFCSSVSKPEVFRTSSVSSSFHRLVTAIM